MPANVTVVGSFNMDMVVQTARFPQPGETVLGGKFLMNPGGKGANQAVTAARLGGRVTMVAKVGTDLFGGAAITGFKREGINTDGVVRDGANPSGVALIVVNDKGQNTIVVAQGANAELSAKDVEAAGANIAAADIVLTQLEIPIDVVLGLAQTCKSGGIRVVLNPAPAQPLPNELLKDLYCITPNENEATILTGITVNDKASARKAAEALRNKGVQNVIVTMGSAGAFLLTNEGEHYIPAPSVNVVDTTAAGDVFNGALAVALGEEMKLREAMAFAVEAASISVTRLGAQASAPHRRELALATRTGFDAV